MATEKEMGELLGIETYRGLRPRVLRLYVGEEGCQLISTRVSKNLIFTGNVVAGHGNQ